MWWNVELAILGGRYRRARRLIDEEQQTRHPLAPALGDLYRAAIATDLTRYEEARRLLSRHLKPTAARELPPAVLGRFEIAVGRVAFSEGAYHRAMEHYSRALDLLHERNEGGKSLTLAAHAMAEALLFVSQPDPALSFLGTAREALPGSAHPVLSGLLTREEANLHYQYGDLGLALKRCRRAIELLEGCPLQLGIAHNLAANIADEIGNPEARMFHRKAALEVLARSENRRWFGRCQHNMGDTLLQTGRMAEAEELLRAWERRSRRYHNPFERGTHHATIAEIAFYRGRIDESLDLYSLASQELEEYPALVAEVSLLLSAPLIRLGKVDEAEAVLRRALNTAKSSRRALLEHRALVELGYLSLVQGDPDAAGARLEEAQRISQGTVALPLVGRRREVEGWLALERNEPAAAAIRFRRAAAIFEALDAPHRRVPALLGLAHALTRQGLGDEARQQAALAASLTRERGLHVFDVDLEQALTAFETAGPGHVETLDRGRSELLGAHIIEMLSSADTEDAVLRALLAALQDLGLPATVLPQDAPARRGAMRIGSHQLVLPKGGSDLELEAVVTLARHLLRERCLRTPSLPQLDPRLRVPGVDLVYRSESMQALMRRVQRFAPTDLPVLITGESGVGKELLARALHALSERRDGPFLPVNCASLPRDLTTAHLFGHRKGAFTGADRDHRGLAEAAKGGTLFLDEIGEFPLDTQAQLLRFLESGEVLPVGETRPRRLDTRIIAATNRNLRRQVEEGSFRQDLYYRLNVLSLSVPPLRERREDIPALVSCFLEREMERTGKTVYLTDAALDRLCRFSYPGNVRELKHTISRLVVLAEPGASIEPEDVGREIEAQTGAGARSEPSPDPRTSLPLAVAQLERRLIEEALREEGSIAKAARRLGVGRSTLYDKMRKLGMDPRTP